MTRKKPDISEFWKNTWASTIGTIIGIVLTFGTTFIIQRCEREETERIAAYMVIHNIDEYCDNVESLIDDMATTDSLCGLVFQAPDEVYDHMPDSILRDILLRILKREVLVNDNTADKIFSSSLDIWKNIEDSKFIETAGNCFSGKTVIDNFMNEISVDKKNLADYYEEKLCLEYAGAADEDLKSHCRRVFNDNRIMMFMLKTHQTYLPALKLAVEDLRQHNNMNKRLMNISDEQLKAMKFDIDDAADAD